MFKRIQFLFKCSIMLNKFFNDAKKTIKEHDKEIMQGTKLKDNKKQIFDGLKDILK